jgi:hypothetical protein
LPKTMGLSAPESVFTGASFTANRILRNASGGQAAGSTDIGFKIDNGGSMNRNACVADGCLFTAPTTPGPFTITYFHREANLTVSLQLQAVKKAAGGRRRRTQRSRRRRGSRRH